MGSKMSYKKFNKKFKRIVKQKLYPEKMGEIADHDRKKQTEEKLIGSQPQNIPQTHFKKEMVFEIDQKNHCIMDSLQQIEHTSPEQKLTDSVHQKSAKQIQLESPTFENENGRIQSKKNSKNAIENEQFRNKTDFKIELNKKNQDKFEKKCIKEETTSYFESFKLPNQIQTNITEQFPLFDNNPNQKKHDPKFVAKTFEELLFLNNNQDHKKQHQDVKQTIGISASNISSRLHFRNNQDEKDCFSKTIDSVNRKTYLKVDCFSTELLTKNDIKIDL